MTLTIKRAFFQGSDHSEFHSVSAASVKELISKMHKTSCEIDPIPASLFNVCIDELIPVITTVIHSLATGRCSALAI